MSSSSASSRLDRFRRLSAAGSAGAATPATSISIPTAEARAGDWPSGCAAYAASYAQSRLWFLQQLEPGQTAYHMPRVWRLRGALDGGALERALGGLIERHATLRTSFRLHGSEVLQLIHPPGAFGLAVEELGERNPEAVIEEWLEEERRTPFDLTAGLLLRARLLQVTAEEHVLLVNHHHIASDGWSQSVLARDLTELYNAHHTGRTPELVPLRVQYQDYAVWQRQRLSGERLRKLTEYWTGELEGLEPLELPGDRGRPVMPTHRGGSVSFAIGAELLQPFEELCRREGATLQMGLLAVVALLLHRYSRQEDVAIGVPIWGRNHPDLEALIGFFINTLPVRTRFQAGQSFRELLAQVRERSIGAYEHQELPFEQMVEALEVERDTSRNPLVQVMVQLMELPESSLANFEGLEVEPVPAPRSSSRFDLELFLRRVRGGGMQATLVYATDLFDPDRIARLGSHLVRLIASAVQAPDAASHRLNLMPEPERVLIESWREGPACVRLTAASAWTVPRLFARQVELTPQATALIGDGQELTYGELEERANRLAQRLGELGVGPECIVAVALERSVEQIVALLAILKAGGAYLPLDPSWPDARRQLVLCQAGVQLLLSLQGPVVIQAPGPKAARPLLSPLAYVTFTSGSSGTPKGVAIEHRGIVRLVDPVNGFQLGPGSAVLQLAPLAFDAATFEIWGPLLNGGTLVLAPPGRVAFADLAELLRRWRITTLFLSTRLFHAMVETELTALAGVRQVLAGGELLSVAPVRRLLGAAPPGHAFMACYGPTESTTFTTCRRLAAGEPGAVHEGELGRPIAMTSVRVLDPAGQLCPIGVPGELHIGGAGLARGYLNQPELTAQSFIPDPFASDPSARLYRSGDLASWNPDGTLVFHGRMDAQIKLRGFRIEPGEIEATLLQHPGVAQAVVVLRHDDPSDPRLIGYWVGQPGTRVSAEALQSHLAERLPEFMLPAALLQLEALPLTENGKLDRRALPEPWLTADQERRVAPTTERERQLHGIWTEVLGHGEFGITDNFFAIGGHSLLSMRLDQLVRDKLGMTVPIHTYFSHPTIQLFSESLASSAQGVHQQWAPVPDRDTPEPGDALPAPIERLLVQQQAFLEQWPGQCAPGHRFVRLLGSAEASGRLFWCFQGANEHQALAHQLASDVKVYGMRSLHRTEDANQIYGDPALLARVAALYAAEVLELTAPGEPLILGGNCQAAWVANAMARELEGAGRRISRLIVMEPRLRELENGMLRWSGPVALIWGRDSRLNPFSPGYRPDSRRLRWLRASAPRIYRSRIEAKLRRAFPGGYRMAVVPGVHGAFFRSENIPGLAASIRETVMEGAGCPRPAATRPTPGSLRAP